MKKLPYTILALLVFSMSMLFGQDAAAAVGAPEVLYENQFLGIIVSTALSALTIGAAWVGRKINSYLSKWGLEQEVIEELSTQVTLIYHDFIKDIKAKTSDNKISKDEALRFRQMARNKALELLKGPAKDFLINKSKDWASAKIEAIISAKKAK